MVDSKLKSTLMCDSKTTQEKRHLQIIVATSLGGIVVAFIIALVTRRKDANQSKPTVTADGTVNTSTSWSGSIRILIAHEETQLIEIVVSLTGQGQTLLNGFPFRNGTSSLVLMIGGYFESRTGARQDLSIIALVGDNPQTRTIRSSLSEDLLRYLQHMLEKDRGIAKSNHLGGHSCDP